MRESKANTNTLKLVLFERNLVTNSSIDFNLTNICDIIEHVYFDRNLPTMFYIHGFLENLQSESVTTIVDAYLFRTGYNIIVLDWSDLADGNYFFDAVPNCVQVGFNFCNSLYNYSM